MKFQYYDFCQRWIDGVDENPDTYYEMKQFALSKPAQVSTQFTFFTPKTHFGFTIIGSEMYNFKRITI